MYFKRQFGITLPLIFCTVGAAQAATVCDEDVGDVCAAPDYAVVFPPVPGNGNTGNCPGASYIAECIAEGNPPSPATLNCTPSNGTLHCEAWPQGTTLTYQWTPFGVTIQGLGNPHNPNAYLTCMPVPKHRITVSVYGPNGEVATATQTILCP